MDFALDDDLDLAISHGDLVLLDDDRAQRAGLILRTYKGNWKQWPLTGLGRAHFIGVPMDGHLKRQIAMQLTADELQPDISFMPQAIDIVLR